MKRALEQATTAKSLKPEQRATARGYLNDFAKPTDSPNRQTVTDR